MVCTLPANIMNIHSLPISKSTLWSRCHFWTYRCGVISPTGECVSVPLWFDPCVQVFRASAGCTVGQEKATNKTRVLQSASIFMKEIGKCKQKLLRQKRSPSALHPCILLWGRLLVKFDLIHPHKKKRYFRPLWNNLNILASSLTITKKIQRAQN